MNTNFLNKLPEMVHDAVIKEIRHSVRKPKVDFLFGDGRCLAFRGLVVFRSESYFNLDTISADKLYISVCEVSNDSWLISEALSQEKPDGEEKWGDEDIANFGMLRTSPLIHINLHCIDWEFDIVCQEVCLSGSS